MRNRRLKMSKILELCPAGARSRHPPPIQVSPTRCFHGSAAGAGRTPNLASVLVQAGLVRAPVRLGVVARLVFAVGVRRDMHRPYLWADRAGVLDVAEPASAPTPPTADDTSGDGGPGRTGQTGELCRVLAHAAGAGCVVDGDEAIPLLHGCRTAGSKTPPARPASALLMGVGHNREGQRVPSGTVSGIPSLLCSTCC